MTSSEELLDELLKGVERPEDLLGDAGLTVGDIPSSAPRKDAVREWQNWALDQLYTIVHFDALRMKMRDADSRMVRMVKNKAIYIALRVTRDGLCEVLGLWIAEDEGRSSGWR